MRSYFFLSCVLFAATSAAAAQNQAPVRPAHADSTRRDTTTRLGGVKVTAERDRKPAITRLTMPVSASISAFKVQETVNLMDTEDAVKYLPSVFLRKRNNGDTQATMATRVWGVSSSARSLVFADGVPLTALIANNNTMGGPRWGLVAPEEIERIDMMYGPFSAAYAGNSMGAVMEITTRMPERFEGSVTQTQGWQPFSLYGTSRDFGTTQTSARIGDRFGRFSFTASGNYQESNSQPLSFVTSASFPKGTTGGYAASNKLNAPANILGASGMLHTKMSNAKVKLAYDITPNVRAAYTLGWWQNDANAGVESFIQRDGTPDYAGLAGFASGNYALLQRHTSQSLSLRSDTKRDWDFEVIGTKYDFGTDKQRFPTAASATGTSFGTPGRAAVLSGSGWSTLDVKGAWHRGGVAPVHTVTFGAHYDRYVLNNPTYNTPDWRADALPTGIFTEGDGKTRTQALWVQDAWRLTPALRLTLGARYEMWRAYDGYNQNGSTMVHQPEVSANKLSPKASLAWHATPDWTFTASVGQAYRFATASELYQLVSTGTTFTSPDANLKPDNVVASELRVEREFQRGRVQLALFNDDVHDAIISQFKPLVAGSNTLYSYLSNVDHVRARGAEVVVDTRNAVFRGFDLGGSVTYLNARTLALSGSAAANAPAGAAVGKRLPNIPDWRASFVATYRPAEKLSMSLGGRYSGKLYTTLDNADVNPNVYQGFSAWFVADAHVNYRINQHVSASVGADNLLNRKYFLFHPFPQRNFAASLKYAF